MTESVRKYFTPEEYLALDDASELKNEYIQGQIYAMSGGSFNHNAISGNIVTALNVALIGRDCNALTSDQRVNVRDIDTYTYPDVSVVCGGPVFTEKRTDTITNPGLIAEVLSPSTAKDDRGSKFAYYRELASLKDYLIVYQDKVMVEYSHRPEPDLWITRIYRGLDAVIDLQGLGVSISLAQIYNNIKFDLQV